MEQFLVSLQPCPDYEPAVVAGAVAAILRDLGGIAGSIAPGGLALIKPNLLAAEPPERAVTTHPEVVRAVVAAFREAGAQVVVGDSPGIGSCRGVAEKTGVAAAVSAAGGRLGTFDQTLNLGHGAQRHFPVAAEVCRADLVVNLPKLKTHGMMVISGAVKNLFGCVVGLRKPGYHMECPDTRAFAAMLLDLCQTIAPGLTIMDAVVCMDGPGPRHGRPRPLGLLIGARDPLALDFVAAEIAGIPARSVPHLRLAQERGMAAADPRHRLVVGLDLQSCRRGGFDVPRELRRSDFSIPPGLVGLARRCLTSRPVVHGKCIDCGACASVCPAGAIAGGRGRARIKRDKCIRCYCCEEMCPHGAITLHQGIIGRLWPWG